MNSLIEALNAWGDHALLFAWPMLWQSSLLIGLLFALDLLTRPKLRPAVRYALWLVVLVKLLLPPSLAFPTGPGWWLRPAKAAPARPRPTTTSVVTYDVHDLPAPSFAPAPIFIAPPPPPPRLTSASWALIGMAAVSLGLLAWMLLRWRQVSREARRSPAAPASLNERFPELPRPVRLKLTDHPMSPAVCGLFRPVILLPRSLVEQLSPAQLRAVLLHEWLHLRRGDVWVNCAQALLQIAYWWHPLLWLANARIRRLREEAVDDAVMLALKEDAETYAPTLLEVAKLALRRPLASLGLVGILESRSSLRQRIERLMDFRPPRKAGLTLGSALAVLGFAALAVPMGEAPPPKPIPESAASVVDTNTSPSTALPDPGLAVEEKIKASKLVQDGKLLYEMGKLDEAEAKLKLALKQDPHNEAALYYINIVSEARFSRAAKEHEAMMRQALRAIPSDSSWPSRTNLAQTTAGRQAIISKLDSIRLDRVSFDGLPLRDVMRFLADECRKRDPEKQGINFLVNQGIDSGIATDTAKLGPDGQPLPATPAKQVDVGAISIKINPPLTDMRLADALDAIVKVADRPIKYSIEDYAIVFSLKTREATPLYVRSFNIDPNTLIEKLHIAKGPLETNVSAAVWPALRDYLIRAGVDLDPTRNPGTALFCSERFGSLVVRASLQDLDIVERAIAALGIPTGQAPTPMAARQAPAGQVMSEARSGEANPIKRELVPVPSPYARTNVVQLRTGRQDIMTKLERIRLDSVSFDGLPLSEVVRFLADESRKRDPEKRGINFLVNQNIGSGANAAAPTLGSDGHPLPSAPAEQVDMNAITIQINPPLTNIRLADVLDAIVKVADQPIKYSIEDYAVVFSPKGRETIPLYVRSFKVDPNTLVQGLNGVKAPVQRDSPRAIELALVNFFRTLAVDLDPKRYPGKTIFFNDRQGMLLVRATLQDLDIIEVALQILNSVPPQINLKCKIVEVSQDDNKALGFDWYLGTITTNGSSTGGQLGVAPSYSGAPTAANPLTGILTEPQFRMVIKALQQRNGANFLSEPSITTLSGRQARCRAMSIQTIVKEINQQALTFPGITSTNGDVTSAFKTEPLEIGPTLDVVPTVMADGYTINLRVVATVLGFAGYDDTETNRVAVYFNGEQKWVTPPRPKVQKREVAATVNVWDGQTLVLGGLVPSIDSNSTQKRNLFIFVTPTIIDPAGNRVHTDEEMPFARDGMPKQPAR